MADFLSPSERSKRMSLIRGRDTKPELALRRVLHKLGLRYRLHVTSLPGSPDLVFKKYKAVVFVHGCFWHRHSGCKIANTPSSNTEFWLEKFRKNQERDERVKMALESLGWTVFVVWECSLSSRKKSQVTGEDLAGEITNRGGVDQPHGSRTNAHKTICSVPRAPRRRL